MSIQRMLACLFALALSVTTIVGCGNGSASGGGESAKFVGRWKCTSMMGQPVVEGGVQTTLDFMADGKAVKTTSVGPDSSSGTGTWFLKGSAIILRLPNLTDQEFTVVSVTDSKLFLKMMGMSFEYAKQ